MTRPTYIKREGGGKASLPHEEPGSHRGHSHVDNDDPEPHHYQPKPANPDDVGRRPLNRIREHGIAHQTT